MDYAAQPAVITNVRRLHGLLLLAMFSIEFRSGAILNYCLLRYLDSKRTILTVDPPKIPRVDFRGVPIKDAAGNIVFDTTLTFRNASVKRHFISTTIQALKAQHPELFTNIRA